MWMGVCMWGKGGVCVCVWGGGWSVLCCAVLWSALLRNPKRQMLHPKPGAHLVAQWWRHPPASPNYRPTHPPQPEAPDHPTG